MELLSSIKGGGKGGGGFCKKASCQKRGGRGGAAFGGAAPPARPMCMGGGGMAPPPLPPPPGAGPPVPRLACAARAAPMASCAVQAQAAAMPTRMMGEASVAATEANEAEESGSGTADGGAPDGDGALEIDFTRVPAELDAKLEALDTDGAMRPTKIKVGPEMRLRSQKALLGRPETSVLRAAEQEREKRKAFDLLDAVSRGGSLPLEHTSLHVIVAATHCFDSSLIDTIVVRNVNPIEKLEKSVLIVAEAIHGCNARQLVRGDAIERLQAYAAPELLPPEP
jgi:hypothetical protein